MEALFDSALPESLKYDPMKGLERALLLQSAHVPHLVRYIRDSHLERDAGMAECQLTHNSEWFYRKGHFVQQVREFT